MRSLLVFTVAAALTGCFRTESKTVSILAGAEESGPRAFSLNTPLVAARAEPVLLSWSPSTGATSYEARIAGDASCNTPVFEQLGAASPSVSVPGLAEGAWHLCVTAKDDDGRRRVAANDGSHFLVDRTPPVVTVLAPPTLAGAKATFTLGGEGVATVVYKAGPTSTAACNDEASYSNVIDARAPLEVTLVGDTDAWTLCLLGEDAAGNRQSLTTATVYPFTADPDLQNFSFDVPAVASGTSLVVRGTAPAAWTTLGSVTVSARNVASGQCFDSATAAFDASCPNAIDVTGTTTWSITYPGAAFADGDLYEIAARAADSGATVDAGTANFAWRYDALTLPGEGSRIINAAAMDAARSIIAVGAVEGSLDLGAVRLAKPANATQDWLVVKTLATGVTAWAKRFIGPAHGTIRSLAVDAAGDIYVLASADGAVTIGATTYEHEGETDVYLLKLAGQSGEPAWVRRLASDKSDAAAGLTLDASGRPVAAMRHCGPLDPGNGLVTPSSCDILLATFSTDAGAVVWKRSFPSTRIAHPETLVAGSDGKLYLAGSFERRLTFGATTLDAGTTDADGFLVALDATGAPLWTKALAGTGGQSITGVALLADGIVFTGQLAANTPAVTKLSSDGTVTLWQKKAAGGNGTSTFDVTSDAAGDVVVAWQAKVSLTIGDHPVALPGVDDLVLARFAAADGALREARAFGSKSKDLVNRPHLQRTASGEILVPMTYGNELTIGSRTLPWPNGFGSLILRHRP